MTLGLGFLLADQKKEMLNNFGSQIKIPNYIIFAKQDDKWRLQNRQSSKKRNTNTENQSQIGLYKTNKNTKVTACTDKQTSVIIQQKNKLM
jgi:hypothetical protein